jgi:hypothetical protein
MSTACHASAADPARSSLRVICAMSSGSLTETSGVGPTCDRKTLPKLASCRKRNATPWRVQL